jgi:hypothetical protein
MRFEIRKGCDSERVYGHWLFVSSARIGALFRPRMASASACFLWRFDWCGRRWLRRRRVGRQRSQRSRRFDSRDKFEYAALDERRGALA